MVSAEYNIPLFEAVRWAVFSDAGSLHRDEYDVGNLTRDPEVRYAQSGMAICKLSVAVTERVKDGDAWKDATEWFRVTVFGKTAENAGQYLQKGKQVYVEGRLKTDKYKDKDGVEKTSIEVIANTLQFLGGAGGGRGGRDAGAPAGASAGGSKGGDAPPPSDGFIDDDLPF
jgi:single-strand DNA-binding protein